MQTPDVRIARSAALPTALVTALAVLGWAVARGSTGAIGALLGGLLVITFFGSGALLSSAVRSMPPQSAMAIGLAGYTVKIALLAVFLVVFFDSDAFDGPAFGITALVASMVWLGAQLRAFTNAKIPTLEMPEASSDAR